MTITETKKLNKLSNTVLLVLNLPAHSSIVSQLTHKVLSAPSLAQSSVDSQPSTKFCWLSA